MAENYSLPDHRGEELYASWDEAYKSFKEDEAITKENVQAMIDIKKQGEEVAELLPTITDPMQWAMVADNVNFTVLISTVGEWKKDNISYRAVMNKFDLGDVENKYFIKVITGKNNYLVNTMSNDFISTVCDIGEDGTRHGQSHVEIASGEKGFLIVDDVEYVFEGDGIYVGVYNNNTNQMIDLVRIWEQNDKVQFIHL